MKKPRKLNKYRERSNESKIKFYTENETEHKQVIVFGKRPDGSEFKVICDWEIIKLIKTLNTKGIRTLWSCMGNACGAGCAYVVIGSSKLSKTKLVWANKYIREYWHDRYVSVDITATGNIAFYAYTKKQLYETDKNMLITSNDDRF